MKEIEKSAKRQQLQAALRLFQKAQHAVPGIVLLEEGLTAIRAGVAGWHYALSIAESITAGAVAVTLLMAIRTLASDIRARRAPHLHFGIDWADIFLGLMLFTEVAASYPTRHKLWRPASALGIVMIFLGIFGGKLAQRRIDRRRAQA